MDKEEIISQGYLEAYMTGDLTTDEQREVETALKELIVSDEYDKIQNTVEWLAQQKGIEPSPVVKRMLMESPEVLKYATPPEASTESGFSWMMAASIVFGLIALGSASFFWNEWKTSEAKLTHVMAQNLELASRYHETSKYTATLAEQLNTITAPAFKKIVLGGTELSPEAVATVFWDPNSGEVRLHSGNLQELGEDEQYQLWVIADGDPVDAGVFDANQLVMNIMKSFEKVNVFAVTIEPKGGSKTPTLSTMQVLGKT